MKIVIKIIIVFLVLLLVMAILRNRTDDSIKGADNIQNIDTVSLTSLTTGMSVYELDLDGVTRTGLVYVPENYSVGSRSAILVLHGGTLGDGQKVADQTDFDAYAVEAGFLVVYPDSQFEQWNDGRKETQNGADDLGYILALTNNLVENYGVNPEQIFVTGVSNGGNMTQWLACNATYPFAGYAPVVSNFPADAESVCDPANPVPMVFFHGTEDPSFGGSESRANDDSILSRGGAGGEVFSAAETIDFWSAKNSCSAPGVVLKIDNDLSDGTSVEVLEYVGCGTGNALKWYKVIGGGHLWFGMDLGPLGQKVVGNPGKEISAVEEIVKFFTEYGL